MTIKIFHIHEYMYVTFEVRKRYSDTRSWFKPESGKRNVIRVYTHQ